MYVCMEVLRPRHILVYAGTDDLGMLRFHRCDHLTLFARAGWNLSGYD